MVTPQKEEIGSVALWGLCAQVPEPAAKAHDPVLLAGLGTQPEASILKGWPGQIVRVIPELLLASAAWSGLAL